MKKDKSHGGWKGGSLGYWTKKAKEIILIHNIPWICQTCGTIKNLRVHHIDNNRTNKPISNLRILCASCHRKNHGHNISIGLKRFYGTKVGKRLKQKLAQNIKNEIRKWECDRAKD